jgi:uroporphyrinogen-III synthase
MSGTAIEKKKIKTILISQPKPEGDKSPYADLAKKHKVKIDFRPFIHVEGLTPAEWRQQRIQILENTCIIFTSRNAVDHLKYFCMSEAIAYYLQKYVVYRKRKIFVGERKFSDMIPLFKKHNAERFLLPSADQVKADILKTLDELEVRYTRGIFYRTVISDLSDLEDVKYDMLVFFSPSGIKSLFHNFPDFVQGETRIAGFGATTQKAIGDHKLRLDLAAPSPEAPSMSAAINMLIKQNNK